jgi:hypothetical protein
VGPVLAAGPIMCGAQLVIPRFIAPATAASVPQLLRQPKGKEWLTKQRSCKGQTGSFRNGILTRLRKIGKSGFQVKIATLPSIG